MRSAREDGLRGAAALHHRRRHLADLQAFAVQRRCPQGWSFGKEVELILAARGKVRCHVSLKTRRKRRQRQRRIPFEAFQEQGKTWPARDSGLRLVPRFAGRLLGLARAAHQAVLGEVRIEAVIDLLRDIARCDAAGGAVFAELRQAPPQGGSFWLGQQIGPGRQQVRPRPRRNAVRVEHSQGFAQQALGVAPPRL